MLSLGIEVGIKPFLKCFVKHIIIDMETIVLEIWKYIYENAQQLSYRDVYYNIHNSEEFDTVYTIVSNLKIIDNSYNRKLNNKYMFLY